MYSNLYQFSDRLDAGVELGGKLLEAPLISEALKDELLVLSIPRGGVAVGAAIAHVLGCAHNIVAVKKVGYPHYPELAIGAVAEDGAVFLNKDMLPYRYKVADGFDRSIDRAKKKVQDFIAKFRSGQPLDIKGKTVILTDDGIATGETIKAAICWINSQSSLNQAKALIVAVPVSSPRTAREIKTLVDKVVCIVQPPMFVAVGQFYWNFDQVSDDEVRWYLRRNDELIKAA